jgi:DNA-binding FrmR family transcriptional regulator
MGVKVLMSLQKFLTAIGQRALIKRIVAMGEECIPIFRNIKTTEAATSCSKNGALRHFLRKCLGPTVLLIDRYSASDGDLFPYQYSI